MTISHAIAQIRANNSLTDAFEKNVGLKQGHGPLLFNLAVEQVIRKLPKNTKGTLLYKSCQFVAYADDIYIIAWSFTSTQHIFINLEKTVNEIGIRISENKTTIMTQTRKMTLTRQNITIDDYSLENVDKPRYTYNWRKWKWTACLLFGSADFKR